MEKTENEVIQSWKKSLTDQTKYYTTKCLVHYDIGDGTEDYAVGFFDDDGFYVSVGKEVTLAVIPLSSILGFIELDDVLKVIH